MKRLAIAFLAVGAVSVAAIPAVAQGSGEEIRFICGQSYNPEIKQRVPTTFQWSPSGKKAIIRWSSQALSNAGFTPQVRCEKVSPNFQKAYEAGTLNFITNALVKGQRVICSVRANDGACDTILFTLRPQDNSVEVLQQLNEIWNGNASGPLEQSSAQPRVYLDVRKFFGTKSVKPVR